LKKDRQAAPSGSLPHNQYKEFILMTESVVLPISFADHRGPIRVCEQSGGSGIIKYQPLVVPAHLHAFLPALTQITLVTMPPESSLGRHQQGTDAILVGVSGDGVWHTDEESVPLSSGTLAIAPRGTIFALVNSAQQTPLRFLLIEMATSEEQALPPRTFALPDLLEISKEGPSVLIGQQEIMHRVATLDLGFFCTGHWGSLSLVEIPAKGRAEVEAALCEESLFVLSGSTALHVDARPAVLGRSGLHALIPRGVPYRLRNRSRKDPLLLLIVQLSRPHQEEHLEAD
jgi:mannose-6-phosphate isomerase-like protein (cupin superfamily)